MKINVYTIDFQIPRWLKRAIIFGVIPAVFLFGAAHYLRADVAVPNTFAVGDTLSAAKMNANFAALQGGINAVSSTVTGLQAAVVTAAVPPGTVVAFTGATAPAGWLLCDGTAVSRTQYAALFAAVGVTYGVGDAIATFGLPDTRGVFAKGAGTTTRADGTDANGNHYHGSLGAYSGDHLQGHFHNPTILSTFFVYSAAGGGPYGVSTGGGNSASAGGGVGVATTDGTNGTPRIATTTEPQSLGFNYIIKY